MKFRESPADSLSGVDVAQVTADRPLVHVSALATVEELFRTNHARLVQFLAKRLGGDIDRAADIAQEAYLRIMRYERPEGAARPVVEHPKAFLYRVAQNVLADERRRDRVRRVDVQVPADQLEIAGQNPNQERILLDREELAAVEAAACDLPPRCRQVFFLSRFEDMPNAAVAKRLGISVSMVEQHIVRAMWEIRQNVQRTAVTPVGEAGGPRLRR
jgi:RNA polymerase sigma factor (sigma-70 family)